MAKTRNFKSKGAYDRTQAFIHMHLHKGASKKPYPVKIRGKAHKVKH